jgi:hypothetical protein
MWLTTARGVRGGFQQTLLRTRRVLPASWLAEPCPETTPAPPLAAQPNPSAAASLDRQHMDIPNESC